MKHRAKIKGSARHTVGTLGGLLAGIGVASSDEIEAVRTLLEAAGVGAELQAAIGAVLLAVAYVMSWRDRTKKVGEGDLE